MQLSDWIILSIIVVISFWLWLFRRRTPIAGQKPGKANTKARTVLEEAGYEIVKVKPTILVNMDIDSKSTTFEMKSDYLVSKSGRRFIVNVRKDNKQVRLQSKLWRGAHLRDVLAFSADGVLVLNVEKETVTQVRFRI